MTSLESYKHLVSTIDPSIRSLGYTLATLPGGELISATHIKLPGGNPADASYTERAMRMAKVTVDSVYAAAYGINNATLTTVVVELPENWAGGRGVSSKDAGSIQKLYFFVGALLGELSFVEGMREPLRNVYLVEPSKWKRQVPKKIMRKRIDHRLAKFGDRALGHHTPHDVSDAVGLLHKFVDSITHWTADTGILRVNDKFTRIDTSPTHLATTKVAPTIQECLLDAEA